ncbi:MAG: hypothetical protein L0Y44_12620 [Phycisphaerales bacterium]|nr:hypothetical protein [Phycisphaerales bacterium]
MTSKLPPIRVNVTPETRAQIKKIAEQYGMNDYAVATRVYQWFADAPEEVQRAVLGMYGDRSSDVLKIVLEDLSKRERKRK